MNEYRSIEIDFEVHKKIESERRNFGETPNMVLRRLLNIAGGAPVSKSTTSGRAWSSQGVVLPHETELRMEYNGRVHVGRIENGAWIVEGGHYNSPSAAASSVARTKSGKRTSLDGWIYWHAKRPSDSAWVPIVSLRDHRTPEETRALAASL